MKKRLLLCFSLAIFMVFSLTRCTEDLVDVGNNMGVFEKEARLYFEQNAPGIQTVRVGDPKESLSRSMTLSSRVITPNWQEGQSAKHGAISSLEVPLTGDVYVKSFYSRVQDGKSQRFLSNVQTKLIIQKHDELKEMRSFVVTIITDKRYEIMHAQSSQICSFLNPKDFSGLMIVSDLEGNYLDAFQFTDGKQQRVALASASEEKDVDADAAVSTFALMDANSAGVYSRSGEGGGGGGVPVPPGELPEVEVWPNCPTCHLPINQCPGHSTPPPLQWYCPHCHSPYCPGTCYQPGGGSGGGNVPVEKKTPLTDKIYHPNSTLTKEQKAKLEEAIDEFTKKYPEFKEMYDKLVEMNTKIICKMDPETLEKVGGLAGYVPKAKSLLFKEEYYIKEAYLQEELIHATQHLEFYGNDMYACRKNSEFEAKVVQDMLMFKHLGYGAQIGSVGQSKEFMDAYSKLLDNYTVQSFNDLCSQWTGYSGTYKPNFTPKVIEVYLKK